MAHTADLTKSLPTKKIKVPAVRIEYKNDRMTDFLQIQRVNQSPAAITGDTLDFRAKAFPGLPSDSSRYSWSGAVAEEGNEASVVYENPGSFPLTLNIFDKNSNRNKSFTATTRTRFVGPEKESDICPSTDVQTIVDCALALDAALLAEAWAAGNDMAPRLGFSAGSCTADDGKCNAAKHAYWNLLMVRDVGPAFAARITTAHERQSRGIIFITDPTGLNAGSAHNSCVMDLENNANGRNIAADMTFTTQAGQGDGPGMDAIITADNNGDLTKLDPLPNPNGGPLKSSSFLTPSNQ